MSKFKYLIPIVFLLAFPSVSHAAAKFWIGGTGNYSDATHWSTTSGGSNDTTKAVAGDTATFDGSSGGGTVTFDEAVTMTTLTTGAFTGTIDLNGQTVTLGQWSNSGTGTRTITMGAANITLSTNAIIALGWQNVTNLTLNAGTATTTLTGNAQTAAIGTSAGSAKTFYSLVFAGSGVMSYSGNPSVPHTFTNFSYTGSAAKTDSLSMSSGFTVTGVLTLAGNSATNRALITSNTLGTARTLTNSGATMTWSNVDFKDITLGTAYDCSAITGLCGDALGNTNFTFTTATTTYWIGDTGNWSNTAEWSWGSGLAGSTTRVPLPQDDVVMDANSFAGDTKTVTIDMVRVGKNWDLSAVTETGISLSKTNIIIYGSMTLAAGTSLTANTQLTFEGRSTYTLTTAGTTVTASAVVIQMFGGTLTLQDALTLSFSMTFSYGNFNANGFNVTIPGTWSTSNNGATRTITFGSGTWTIAGTGGYSIPSATGITLVTTGSTIVMSNTTATAKTFTGMAQTYNNLTIIGDDITITGNNTFTTLTLDNGSEAEGTIIGTGSTQTVTSLVAGSTCTSGTLCLLFGVAAGGAETISDTSGTNCLAGTTVTNITASGGASFYASDAAADGTGNSGWTFSACPGVGGAVPNEDIILFQ